MIKVLKTEFMKEKRSANVKLMLFVPILFVVFNVLMISLMGQSPSGKSYIMATSFNWYPVLILPVVLSLLVVNISEKEKTQHIDFQRTMNVRSGRIVISKNIVVIVEFFIILLVSAIAIYLLGSFIMNEEIETHQLMAASASLFIGSLPVIGISFVIHRLVHKKFLLILINFVLTLPSALIAVTGKWILFPWAYSLRILSPVIGVHPNGTFLASNSPLMNIRTTYLGIILSVVFYLVISLGILMLERRKSDV